MAILRNSHRDRFTTFSNDILTAGVSLEACGIYVYLLSKPDGWQIKGPEIEKRWHIGRDKRLRIMNELEAAGFIEYRKKRNNNGTLAGKEVILHEASPRPEKPKCGQTRTSADPNFGKADPLVNTDKETNTEEVVNTHSRAPRKRDEIFEAICEACDLNQGQLTASERGRVNRAAKELRKAQATGDEILRRAAAYRRKWPKIDITPQGITGNWSKLAAQSSVPKLDLGDSELPPEASAAPPGFWDQYAETAEQESAQ